MKPLQLVTRLTASKAGGAGPSKGKICAVSEGRGRSQEPIEHGEVESRRGMHAAEAVVFHFSDGTALSIEIGSNARGLSTSRDLTPPDVHTNLRPFWSHRARPHD